MLKPSVGALPNIDDPLFDGLLLFLVFNNGAGADLFDYSLNGVNASLVDYDPDTDWVNNDDGPVVENDGSNGSGYVLTDADWALPVGTVEIRLYLRSVASNPVIFHKASSTTGYIQYFFGSLDFYPDGPGPGTTCSWGSLSLNTWHTIHLTVDGVRHKAYTNGFLQDNVGSTRVLFPNTDPFQLGRFNVSTAFRIDGFIEYTRVWDRPLSEDEIYHSHFDRWRLFNKPDPSRLFFTPSIAPVEPSALDAFNPQVKNLKQSGLIKNLKETGSIDNLKVKGKIKWVQ